MRASSGPTPPEGDLSTVAALARLWRRSPVAVAGAVAALALALTGLAVAVHDRADGHLQERVALCSLGVAVAICASVGALVVAGRPRHGMGVALLVGGLGGAVWFLSLIWVGAIEGNPHGRPLYDWATWVSNWSYVGLVVLVTWPLLLFPTGALPSRRWLPVGWLLAVSTVAIGISSMLDPGVLDDTDVQNPLGVPESWSWTQVPGVLGVLIPPAIVAGAVAVHRQARAHPGTGMRAAVWATRLLAVNFVVCLGLNLADSSLADGTVYLASFTISIVVFAVVAAVAVLWHRVVEIDLLVRRAFVVAGVSVASLVVFGTVFAVVTAVAGSTTAAIGGGLALVAVAVPLRIRVQDRVDRALYGHRDAYAAVRRVNEELDVADAPADALEGLARAAAETLGASAVVIQPAEDLGLPEGRAGVTVEQPALDRELRHQGAALGRLIVGARAPGEAYGPGDVALVEVLARQTVLALNALRLAHQLRHSREEIIQAREEERRRLRRELHDGLGPALAGIALTLEAARNTDGPGTDELVEGAQELAQAAVADVRRLVRGLRPPVLDDLGLTAALRAHAGRLGPLRAEIDIPEDVPARLSAAAELAVYRIATEALTNVVRHAGADSCRVALRVEGGDLRLRVTDDGRGVPEPPRAGVGLTSMRERAAELGGRVTVGRAEARGTAVELWLPLDPVTP